MDRLPPAPGAAPTAAPPGFWARLDDRLDAWWLRNRIGLFVTATLVVLLYALLAPTIFVTIPSGHRGVMFRRLGQGTEVDRTYPEGFYVVPPWDIVTVYDLRVQQSEVETSVLTSEGLQIAIKLSVRYRPRQDKLAMLHQGIGPYYFEKIVRPEIQAGLRTLAGSYTAEEIYSTKRRLLEQALENSVRAINDSYLVLDSLLICEVNLPPSLLNAIETKASAEQAVLTHGYRIEFERKEAERKRIEAEGVRDFQNVVSQGISPELLRWRGIEATLELSKSDNSKVVVIGSGKEGLPLILDATGRDEGAAAPRPPRRPAPEAERAAGARR